MLTMANRPVQNQSVEGKKNPNIAWGVNAAADLGKNVNLFAGYDEFKNDKDVDREKEVIDGKDKIFDVALKFKLGKDAKLHRYLPACRPGRQN